MLVVLACFRYNVRMAPIVASPYMKKDLRVPPHSLDAEMAVLGSIMLRKDALFDITDIITVESFYSEKNKRIYNVMLELSTRNDPIDLLSVKTK